MATLETMQNLNLFLAYDGLIGILATLVLLIDLFGKQRLKEYVRRFGFLVAFLGTLGGMLMALFYSEFFGIVPCGLCWFERIFLFPQAIILGVALYIKDKTVAIHGIVLSTLGLIISLYHHYIQMSPGSGLPCPTSGGDCGKRILYEFDFMTFPLLGAILFAFLIVLYIYIRRTNSTQ